MKKINISRFTAFSLGFLALILLVGCQNGNNSSTVSDRDTLIVGFPSNPAEIDPHAANDVPSRQISAHVFENLLVRDADGNLQPGLATSWELVEDNIWQFTIREGVTFHNGEPLTANDVAFSIKRVSQSAILSPIFGMFEPELIEVIDDYTVNIGTAEPFAPALIHLSHHAAAILSESAVGDTPMTETTLEQLVGSGPYKITKLEFDEIIVLERFENFHGEHPNMRVIEFRIMPDPHTRTLNLEAGEVDVIINVAPTDIASLTDNPEFTMTSTPSHGVEYVGLNFRNDYLGVREVRQAINYALQNDVIVQVSTEGTHDLLSTYVAPSVFGFSPDVEPHGFDLDRAKELMDEAGIDGFDMDLLINSGSAVRLAAAEIIQNQLQLININVNIRQLEWAAYLEARNEGDFDAFIGGWSNPSGDADNGLVPILYTDVGDIRINSAELDAMLMEGRRTVNEAERLAIYHDVLVYLREAAPFVLLGNSSHFMATQNNVTGIQLMPSNVQFYGSAVFTE